MQFAACDRFQWMCLSCTKQVHHLSLPGSMSAAACCDCTAPNLHWSQLRACCSKMRLQPTMSVHMHLQASELYDRQRLYVSMACRNPHKGLMCEAPAVQRIDFYQGIDVPLATFLAATGPNFEAPKRCAHPGCGGRPPCCATQPTGHGGRLNAMVNQPIALGLRNLEPNVCHLCLARIL